MIMFSNITKCFISFFYILIRQMEQISLIIVTYIIFLIIVTYIITQKNNTVKQIKLL